MPLGVLDRVKILILRSRAHLSLGCTSRGLSFFCAPREVKILLDELREVQFETCLSFFTNKVGKFHIIKVKWESSSNFNIDKVEDHLQFLMLKQKTEM